jgi:hypothetical protein
MESVDTKGVSNYEGKALPDEQICCFELWLAFMELFGADFGSAQSPLICRHFRNCESRKTGEEA